MQSAMNTAVSGLIGNTQKINAIAQNIAGSNTDGYKRTEVVFSTLVTQQDSNTSYSPGGVKVNSIQHVEQRGDLRSAASATDIAVDGAGFFVVSPNANSDAQSYFYTRAGSFKTDNNGYLRNTAGYYLQGFQTDSNGDPLAINTSVLSSLETVNVSRVNGISTPTTTIRIGANLPSEDDVGEDYIETIAIYDSLGVERHLNFRWEKVAQDGTTQTWHLSIDSPQASFENITKSTGNAYGGTITGLTAVANGFTTSALNNTLTLGYAAGNVSSVTVTGAAFPASVSVTIGDESYTNDSVSTPTTTGQLTLTSTSNSNNVLVFDYNTTSVAGINASVAAFSAGLTTFLTGASFGTTPLVIIFDQNGAPVSYDGADTPPDITIDWSDSLTNAEDNTVELTMGTVGELDGVICKAGPYNLTFSSQNGVKFGNFSGIAIERDGIVSATFDNGQSLKIYKIPLANFANPNRMDSRSGDAFMQTDASGTYLLKFAGTGGIGNISSKTLESSTVELATEFSNMIVAQRQYSANIKVISTSDEMLASLDRVK